MHLPILSQPHYDGKRYFLAALGLTPEEVKRRVEEDVVKDLDNWDGDAK